MNRLSIRLSLAFLLSAWIGIGAMVLVVQRALDVGFHQYVTARDSEINQEQVTRLEGYYRANGSWQGVETILSGRGQGSSSGSGRGAMISIANLDGVIVASTDSAKIGLLLAPESLEIALPLEVDDKQVGWLSRLSPGVQALGAAEIAFLSESNRWLAVAGVGATLLALAVGIALSWTLARPLRELTNAVRVLSVGQLGAQVKVRGTVEVNTLVAEFNTMSKALAEGETLRQRMAADVAHELRTPVSILRGHLEAMLDGIYPLDSAHIAIAHDQTIHLARLVEDLRVLTLAESRRLPLEFTRLNPTVLVTEMIEAFEPLALDSEIRLTHKINPALPDISADATRIRQVFSNLLTNALRHTSIGGEIAVQVMPIQDGVRFSVTNTGKGLSQTETTHIFQPFWRAESARERDSGGSGLGLAISREIITLHGGSMTVENSDNRVTFVFTLPAIPEK